MTNIELQFFEMAKSFFAKQNKKRHAKLLIVQESENANERLVEETKNLNIVDIKVTPVTNELIFTIIYTD